MSVGKEQACNYCGESMGVFEHRYSDGPLSCGSKECARAEREEYLQRQDEAAEHARKDGYGRYGGR